MTPRLTLFALAGLVLCANAPVFAHHSLSAFDLSSRVTVTGTVASLAWTNPHALLEIDGAEVDGGQKRWTIELASPTQLQRLGWTSGDLRYRDRVTAVVFPLKSGEPGGVLVEVTLADGRVLANGGAAAPR